MGVGVGGASGNLERVDVLLNLYCFHKGSFQQWRRRRGSLGGQRLQLFQPAALSSGEMLGGGRRGGQMRGAKGQYSSHCWKLLVGRAVTSDPLGSPSSSSRDSLLLYPHKKDILCNTGLWSTRHKITDSCVTVLCPGGSVLGNLGFFVFLIVLVWHIQCYQLADPHRSSDSTWLDINPQTSSVNNHVRLLSD